jgi:hypothetical protein
MPKKRPQKAKARAKAQSPRGGGRRGHPSPRAWPRRGEPGRESQWRGAPEDRVFDVA